MVIRDSDEGIRSLDVEGLEDVIERPFGGGLQDGTKDTAFLSAGRARQGGVALIRMSSTAGSRRSSTTGGLAGLGDQQHSLEIGQHRRRRRLDVDRPEVSRADRFVEGHMGLRLQPAHQCVDPIAQHAVLGRLFHRQVAGQVAEWATRQIASRVEKLGLDAGWVSSSTASGRA